MLPLVPLLARRAADLPRYRVRAALRHTPGHGAELAIEPLAWRNGRPGDIPYDLLPDPVPEAERAPYAGLETVHTDATGLHWLRSWVDRISASGVPLAEGELRALDQLRDATDSADAGDLDATLTSLDDLQEQLSRYTDPAARALADEIARDRAQLAPLGYPDL